MGPTRLGVDVAVAAAEATDTGDPELSAAADISVVDVCISGMMKLSIETSALSESSSLLACVQL